MTAVVTALGKLKPTDWGTKMLKRLIIWTVAGLMLVSASTGSAFSQEVSSEIRSATQHVIRDQISAFQSQDHERAFSHAAPTIRNIFKTTERFIGMVKGGYLPLYDPDNFIFGRNIDISGTIHQEVIATDRNGKQWHAVYTLEKQIDGSWKITGVKMEPYEGATT